MRLGTEVVVHRSVDVLQELRDWWPLIERKLDEHLAIARRLPAQDEVADNTRELPDRRSPARANVFLRLVEDNIVGHAVLERNPRHREGDGRQDWYEEEPHEPPKNGVILRLLEFVLLAFLVFVLFLVLLSCTKDDHRDDEADPPEEEAEVRKVVVPPEAAKEAIVCTVGEGDASDVVLRDDPAGRLLRENEDLVR